MANETATDARLQKLRLHHIRAYAERRGWQRKDMFRDVLAIFDRGPGSLDQLLVPANPDFDDFAEQMNEVVVRLARAEARAAANVLEDLLSFDVDTVRFSVRSPVTQNGTLPLEQGLALLDGARRSLLAAACTVLAPGNTYHPRMSRGEAEEFVQACELGQTEKGSYTVALRCPVYSSDLSAAADATRDPPFARKATEVLAASLAHIADAIDHDQVDSLLQPGRDHVQVSANLCDALIKMQPEADQSAIAVSFSWAAAQPARVGTQQVVLRNEHFPVISGLSQRLRGPAPPQAAPFFAHVDELRGTMDPDGRRQGDVRLTIYHEDEVVKARTQLNADQYDLAGHAHMTGHAVVIAGILQRGPRVSTITDVTTFELLKHDRLGTLKL